MAWLVGNRVGVTRLAIAHRTTRYTTAERWHFRNEIVAPTLVRRLEARHCQSEEMSPEARTPAASTGGSQVLLRELPRHSEGGRQPPRSCLRPDRAPGWDSCPQSILSDYRATHR